MRILCGSLILSSETTLAEDVAYGARLVMDIAERSLADSPFRDPTTAVQAIDRLHDILRQLAAGAVGLTAPAARPPPFLPSCPTSNPDASGGAGGLQPGRYGS